VSVQEPGQAAAFPFEPPAHAHPVLSSHAELDAESELAEIEMIYRTAPVGLCLLDRNLRYVRVNERLAEMNGLPAAAHIGRTVREIVPNLADDVEPLMRRVFRTGEPLTGIELVGETAAQPGVKRIWVESWAPLVDRDGKVLGINIMAEEVTERRNGEKLREAFAGLLSHELRTPITTIYGAAKLLARTVDRAETASLLEDIEAEADRLNQLVEDMLVLSRTQHGALDLPAEPLLLAREVTEVIERIRQRYPRVTIRSEVDVRLPAVGADRTALHQVLVNLLTNGAKYAGGEIQLRAASVGSFVEVSVDDSGPGFTADEADRLFELFYRAPGAASANGSGIGLFVVKSLVEAMGGTVQALPRQPCGASFRFTLPVMNE
jgi:PAS domain S-box-containing protein